MQADVASQSTYPLAPSEYPPASRGLTWRKVREFIFLGVFLLCFWLSGVLSIASILWLPFDYRMGLAVFLALPLIGVYGIRLTYVTLSFALLVLIILISGLLNNSSLTDIGLFLRIPFFAFMIYRFAEICLSGQFLLRILRLCVPLAVVQLPILLVQRLLYSSLPAVVRAKVSSVDFDFGTFNFKGDSKMAFFLIMMVIFLLFYRKSYLVTRRRGLLAIWATATVLLANSEIAKLAVVMVWGVYFVTKLNRKFTLRLLGGVCLFLMLFALSGYATTVVDSLSRSLMGNIYGLGGDPREVQRYLNGEYSRGGAIYYYLNNDILWFGDGPSTYSNPVNRERTRGDVGHIFTFYSEIGLFGLATSLLIFALIAFPIRGSRIRVGLQPLLMFGVVLIFVFTQQTMNDISVMLAYCIFARTHLLSHFSSSPKTAAQYHPPRSLSATV